MTHQLTFRHTGDEDVAVCSCGVTLRASDLPHVPPPTYAEMILAYLESKERAHEH